MSRTALTNISRRGLRNRPSLSGDTRNAATSNRRLLLKIARRYNAPMNLHGIIAALPTPFDETGEVAG